MRPSPSLSLRIRAHLTHRDTPEPKAPVQVPITAAYYRGGTSRAVFFQPQHLPQDRAKWPSIFRQVMGSGDPFGRQLDGMGAGISSLSKICLVEPHGKRRVIPKQAIADRISYQSLDGARSLLQNVKARGDAVNGVDVDYTFVGLGIENDEVDVAGNCGNMSSAIGPYAYNAGLLPPRIYAQGNGQVTITIRNTNTGKLISSTFDVAGGQAAVVGNYTIDGVTGSGSKIKLDFKHPYGSKTGKVLPTGHKVDHILDHKVSCVDGANPCIFIRASDVGVDGTILPNDFNKLPDKLALLERIRKAAAVAMGIAPTEDAVPRTIPKIGLISMSSAHPVLSGQTLQTSQTDLVVRFLSDTQPHRAIPLTAALTTAVAARIPGTLVEQMLAPDPVMDGAITIGHASGRLQVDATMDEKDKIVPVNGTVYRTAKRLFEGTTFWTDDVTNKSAESALQSVHGTNGTHSLGMAFVLESRGQSTKDLWAGEAEEAEQDHMEQLEEPSLITQLRAKPSQQDADRTEKLAPIRMFYRPHEHRPSNKKGPVITPPVPGPPSLSTRSHPTPLTAEPDLPHTKLPAAKGTEWSQWAKQHNQNKRQNKNKGKIVEKRGKRKKEKERREEKRTSLSNTIEEQQREDTMSEKYSLLPNTKEDTDALDESGKAGKHGEHGMHGKNGEYAEGDDGLDKNHESESATIAIKEMIQRDRDREERWRGKVKGK